MFWHVTSKLNNIIETYIFQYTSCVYKNKKPNISQPEKAWLGSGERLKISILLGHLTNNMRITNILNFIYQWLGNC